jgi:hypothetical protein
MKSLCEERRNPTKEEEIVIQKNCETAVGGTWLCGGEEPKVNAGVSYKEIVLRDQETLKRLGVTSKQIADCLLSVPNAISSFRLQHPEVSCLQNVVYKGEYYYMCGQNFETHYCPFGTGCKGGLESGVIHNVYVTNMKTEEKIKYNSVTIHMMKMHDFYGSNVRLSQMRETLVCTRMHGT